MCRTIHSILGTIICGLQMLVRVMMTVILMMENLIRMFLQTFYNFISFMLQMISLVPICLVFLITSRLKCFMCGGGGPCPVNRGGTCDCLMSAVAIMILFFIFRATGLLDKIFYKIGYAKATPEPFTRFVPTPGEITECSRETNETNEDYETTTTTTVTTTKKKKKPLREEITESESEYESDEEEPKAPSANNTTTQTTITTNLSNKKSKKPLREKITESEAAYESEEEKPTETSANDTTTPLTTQTSESESTSSPTGRALRMFDDMLTTLIYYIE